MGDSIQLLRTGTIRTHDIHGDSPNEHRDHGPKAGVPGKHGRHRACITCRDSKIRCINAANETSCRACLKNNRQCIMSGPTKSRMRTANRISSLEEKIAALTAMLLARNEANIASASTTSASQLNQVADDSNIATHDDRGPDSVVPDSGARTTRLSISNRTLNSDVVVQPPSSTSTEAALFDHWVQNMYKYIPSIDISGHETAQDIRNTRPELFSAIVVVASASIKPAYLPDLLARFNRRCSELIFITGDRSLDVLQALLVYITHFVTPMCAKNSPYIDYVYSAVSICFSINLDVSEPESPATPRIGEGEDMARTWLTCYFTASRYMTHNH